MTITDDKNYATSGNTNLEDDVADDLFVKMGEGDEDEDEREEHLRKMCFCKRLWAKYDHQFLIVYGVAYANAGLKFLQTLAIQDLFKNYYFLEPSQSQFYTTLIYAPWMFKFLYGLTADSLPICGSRKKAWILLWGVAQTLSLTVAAFVRIESINLFMLLISINAVALAFMDVVVDSLMVMQARRDPK